MLPTIGHFEQLRSFTNQLGITLTLCSQEELSSHAPGGFARGMFSPKIIVGIEGRVEENVFILIHSLGHIARWHEVKGDMEYSYEFQSKQGTWSEEDLLKHYEHECGSVSFSLGLLQLLEMEDLQQWFLEYFYADQQYMNILLRENKNPSLSLFTGVLKKVQEEGVCSTSAQQFGVTTYPSLSILLESESYIYVV